MNQEQINLLNMCCLIFKEIPRIHLVLLGVLDFSLAPLAFILPVEISP